MRGKTRRLNRIFKDGKTFIAALDHGISLGFAQGLEDLPTLIEILSEYVDAIIVNKGVLASIDDKISSKIGIIFKLNGITSRAPNPYDLQLIASIEEAISYDADAVSYELYIGGPQESRQIREAGLVVKRANKWDIPVILHIYPHEEKNIAEMTSHCLRLGWELGADVVKTYLYSGMREHVAKIKIPVVVAGGPKLNHPSEVLEYVRRAIQYEGVSGVALGRNLWGWGVETAKYLASAIRDIIKRATLSS